MAFIETNDVTKPAGSRARSLGDDDIREFKCLEIERQAVDHDRRDIEASDPEKTVAPDGTIGYHKKVTLPVRSSNESAVASAAVIYSKDVSAKAEVHIIDEDSNVIQLTSGGKIKAENLNGVYPAADTAAVASILAKLLPSIYPVGSVITLGVSTNPNTLFGFGTWTAIAGKVIVGINAGDAEFDTLDETGGAKTHTLITAEMPAHTHDVVVGEAACYADGGPRLHQGTGVTLTSASTGGGGAHNNLQPYIVKYVWQRTA